MIVISDSTDGPEHLRNSAEHLLKILGIRIMSSIYKITKPS